MNGWLPTRPGQGDGFRTMRDRRPKKSQKQDFRSLVNALPAARREKAYRDNTPCKAASTWA